MDRLASKPYKRFYCIELAWVAGLKLAQRIGLVKRWAWAEKGLQPIKNLLRKK